jgi:hypothetical protein
MADTVSPNSSAGQGLQGLTSMFQYVNGDGTLQETNCGQAAAATILTHYGIFEKKTERPNPNMTLLEDRYPPDVLFGVCGTSKTRMRQMLNENRLSLLHIKGETQLKNCIRNYSPVVVMLGISQVICGMTVPGGHWMVAYAYDNEYVYLTNYGQMSWGDFKRDWDSVVSLAIDMQNKGIVPYYGG